MSGNSPYPKFFATPAGRPVSIRTMAKALRQIKGDPYADYPGWEWFPIPGHWIIRSFRAGIHHRINMRAAIEGRKRHASTPA